MLICKFVLIYPVEKSQEVKDDKEDKKKMLRLEDRFLFTDVLYPTLQDLRVILPDPDLPNNSANVEGMIMFVPNI